VHGQIIAISINYDLPMFPSEAATRLIRYYENDRPVRRCWWTVDRKMFLLCSIEDFQH